jgi:hypothetical protein
MDRGHFLKLIIFGLANKYTAFYGNRKFFIQEPATKHYLEIYEYSLQLQDLFL